MKITITIDTEPVEKRKYDYIRLPDGRYRYWPESVRKNGYHIYASRNSVLVYLGEYPGKVTDCGSVYRTETFCVKSSIDAPQWVQDTALKMYDEMIIGTLNQNRK